MPWHLDRWIGATAQDPTKTQGSWQSESGGDIPIIGNIATETEGWVKYVVGSELVYIHWDNPFIWAHSTQPIDFTVSTSDVTPPCDEDQGGGGSAFVLGGTLSHELFPAGRGGSPGITNVTWWDVLVNWPALILFNFTGDEDINLEFTLGLRERGSVRQTLLSFYDGSKGLRALANEARVSNLRKLFRM